VPWSGQYIARLATLGQVLTTLHGQIQITYLAEGSTWGSQRAILTGRCTTQNSFQDLEIMTQTRFEAFFGFELAVELAIGSS
jgi:hypothetical protein